MRKATSLVGLAVVLSAAYWFDLYVLPPLRLAAGNNFDPAPAMWTVMAAQIGVALAVMGLAWMLFRWSPPSRLVGLIYLVIGLGLAGAWPITLAFHADIPGFAQLNLYLALQQPDGLLTLIAPFLVALGFLRLVLPLPSGWRTVGTTQVADREPTTMPS
jgi:hypothetical protein